MFFKRWQNRLSNGNYQKMTNKGIQSVKMLLVRKEIWLWNSLVIYKYWKHTDIGHIM